MHHSWYASLFSLCSICQVTFVRCRCCPPLPVPPLSISPRNLRRDPIMLGASARIIPIFSAPLLSSPSIPVFVPLLMGPSAGPFVTTTRATSSRVAIQILVGTCFEFPSHSSLNQDRYIAQEQTPIRSRKISGLGCYFGCVRFVQRSFTQSDNSPVASRVYGLRCRVSRFSKGFLLGCAPRYLFPL